MKDASGVAELGLGGDNSEKKSEKAASDGVAELGLGGDGDNKSDKNASKSDKS